MQLARILNSANRKNLGQGSRRFHRLEKPILFLKQLSPALWHYSKPNPQAHNPELIQANTEQL